MCVVVFSAAAQAQHRFEDEIVQFEQLDNANPPNTGQILFTGSSSIRMWKSLSQDFPDVEVINRGFGGSTFDDLLHFYERVILPYSPKKILIYEGDNDIADGQSAKQVLQNFKALTERLRKDFPSIEIAFISIKPSPARWDLHKEMENANRLIHSYCQSEGLTFLDVYHSMVHKKRPIPDYFVSDSLHMTDAGYKVWVDTIRPFIH